MLNQPIIEKLHAMRLRGMAEAFRAQQEQTNVHQLSFEERLGMLVDQQWNWREDRALDRRLRNARLQGTACMEEIDYQLPRGLNRQLVRSLTQNSDWVRRQQHVLITGKTGTGKTFLARAFGQKACRDGLTALFIRAEQMFRELEISRMDGSYGKKLSDFSRVDVLIVDDWAMAPLDDGARRAFLEICDERYQTHSTLLTSQLPVTAWHAQIGDPTLADSILDRIVHNAHRIDLEGESIRKLRKKDGNGREGK